MISDRHQLDAKVDEDYTILAALLAADKWEQADEETMRVMLKITNRETPGWLDLDSLQNFPDSELRNIDELWLKHSDGRFGYSVQKQLFYEVGKDYEKLGDRVGWRQNGDWLYYRELTFDISAPVGHLPLLPFPIWCWHPAWGFLAARSAFFVLLSRLKAGDI